MLSMVMLTMRAVKQSLNKLVITKKMFLQKQLRKSWLMIS